MAIATDTERQEREGDEKMGSHGESNIPTRLTLALDRGNLVGKIIALVNCKVWTENNLLTTTPYCTMNEALFICAKVAETERIVLR
jgi:hypothetical protein